VLSMSDFNTHLIKKKLLNNQIYPFIHKKKQKQNDYGAAQKRWIQIKCLIDIGFHHFHEKVSVNKEKKTSFRRKKRKIKLNKDRRDIT
jgi:hypothetical protein